MTTITVIPAPLPARRPAPRRRLHLGRAFLYGVLFSTAAAAGVAGATRLLRPIIIAPPPLERPSDGLKFEERYPEFKKALPGLGIDAPMSDKELSLRRNCPQCFKPRPPAPKPERIRPRPLQFREA